VTYPEPEHDLAAQTPEVLGALTVLGEARGEGTQGKLAVAHVIRNRMAKSGKSVADTVLAPWQFSCWNQADPNRLFLEETVHKAAKNIPLELWVKCLAAFSNAASGKEPDPTQGATHYCVSILWGVDDGGRRRPRWHSKQCLESGKTVETVRIGSHVFGRTA
jgi:spore germination cell wall hydrolase CwlJ-like protein